MSHEYCDPTGDAIADMMASTHTEGASPFPKRGPVQAVEQWKRRRIPLASVETESTNPKRGQGRKKPCAQYIPPAAILEEAAVMRLGAEKYGRFNWQEKPVDASTYYDAIMRHLMQWFTGEDLDPESGCSHLAHIRASAGILIDAMETKTLIDDRPVMAGKASDVIARHMKT